MNLLLLTNQYFSFLNQYGYCSTQEDSEFCVSYIGDNNKIIVIYTEYSYEITCHFEDKITLNNFSLQDALEYCSIDNLKGIYQISNNNDLEKGLIYIANVIKKLYADIDVSNKHIFNDIYDYTIKRREEALNEYYIREELKKADHYWNNNNISEAYKIYLRNIEHLSLSQIKKLCINEFDSNSIKADRVLKSKINSNTYYLFSNLIIVHGNKNNFIKLPEKYGIQCFYNMYYVNNELNVIICTYKDDNEIYIMNEENLTIQKL